MQGHNQTKFIQFINEMQFDDNMLKLEKFQSKWH